ncbi:ATP-binding protein [Nitrospirillum sp. BR 11164]|uniref:ATP-binding protein n=1 Tax=Nitrospirillum sp. BR 11164 TaxID=3104324 RepID=UPI002AFFA413|nr:ATP-binding protein [Nitrospirillum sp. BR 11164]MEA1650306.1 ATP-binding protein [Nitrospirillum sp. BR 11164]
MAERTREIATANRMLEGALKEARAANEAKTRFLANMSHEIRTPMNAVLGFIGLVLERETRVETHRQLLMAHKAAKSLLALINDILDLSRLQSGGLALEPVIFDLRGELRACVDLVREKAREKDISLQFDYADDLPLSHLGDSVRVRQIVTNLMANAIKFTQAGRVLLKAGPAAQGMVEISVADTGIGLTSQQAAHVFDRFHQMDDAATRRFSGLGLGVSICKELVDLMGGTVGVESEPGLGSTFRACLPLPAASSRMAALSKPSSPCPDAASRPAASPYRRFKVLLADDVSENLELAEIHLLAQGHDVTRAHDGREAVEKARQLAFDIILMDVQMPRLSGKAAVRLIREFERETGRHVPVIALSANDCSAERRECLEAGMTAYMTKPLDFDALGALAQQLVPHDGGEPMPEGGPRIGALARATPQIAREMTALCQVLESDDPDLIEPVLDRLGMAGLELKALVPLRRLVADFEFAQARALATGMTGAMAGAVAEGGHQGEGARG